MSMTIYEGKLSSTGLRPEAETDFADKKVQDYLYHALKELADNKAEVTRLKNREIWIHCDDLWIRINPDGVIELGYPAV